MSDKPAKPAEAAPAAEAPKKSPKMKMIVAGAIVMILEGATVGVTMMMAGGPKKVVADVPATAPAEAVVKYVEVNLIDAKLPNKKSGQLYLYDLAIFVKTEEKNKAKLTELKADQEAEIKDRIRTIIASTDPQTLAEPGLETLRRQLAYQLEENLGKDIIKEVLISKCTPIRAEY